MSKNYPPNLEVKLGFDAIRTILRDKCESSMGKSEVDHIQFSSDIRIVTRLLNQTWEMKLLYESHADFPDVIFSDIAQWLTELKLPGSYASVEELNTLCNVLSSFLRIREFFLKKTGKGEDDKFLYPALANLFQHLELFPELIKEIEKKVDKGNFIKDSASEHLAEVRRELAGMNGRIAKTIQKIYANAVKEGFADKDTAPTFRDGRMVIPLPASNKRTVPGIVHDESATGKTVFVEPAETVELGNRLRELQLEEQREVVKILISLTDIIRPYIDDIIKSNNLLGKLDFIMAKARFAIEVGGEMPSISPRPEIDWYGAIHPILLLTLKKQAKQIVPLNLRLDSKSRILIISGPNAGGKSVTLKTAGIVQYMFQCGLLPTLYSNSHLGIFEKIFIDIGDEQSLENDLSTYSSHLKNMRYFLLHSNPKTLILIDEIGSGTEPNIGSSLAEAILLKLENTRCYGVVTTHYHNLKRFAEETQGFVNGAMLYDRQKLQPTFQLSIGSAGSSFALEIAGKIGLPKDVIDMAKEIVGEDYVESDKYLMEIARDRKYWQSKRANIKDQENKLLMLTEKYETIIADLNRQRKEIIRNAKEEAKELLSGANKQIENTISAIKSAEAEKEKTRQARERLKEYKEELDNTNDDEIKINKHHILPVRKKKKNQQTPAVNKTSDISEVKDEGALSVGDYVKMPNSATTGKILKISGKEAEVAFGLLRTTVKLDKLSKTTAPKETISTGVNILNGSISDSSRRRQLEFQDELDIRGMRADEAIDKTIHFLDDALQFGIKKVRILHGTGHGILRQLVRQQLNITPGIIKFEDEDVRLGGSGITVVTLGYSPR